LFSILLSLPPAAIFAIINEPDRKVYIGYSEVLPARLGQIVTDINRDQWKYPQMVQERAKLSLLILDTNPARLFVNYYKNKYRNMGYEIYNDDEKPHVQYKFKVVVDYRLGLIEIVAVTRRNDQISLGAFKKISEAEKFFEYINKYNEAGGLVYSIGKIDKRSNSSSFRL
jgi:hypothetical protein